jgi:putative NADPH-quinone reductase
VTDRRRILIINGHPDPSPQRLCAALSEAYGSGAAQAGREVRHIAIGDLDFPLLQTAEEFGKPATADSVLQAQAAITWADHLVIVHPLWLGGAPARLKGFLEQVLRYGFALAAPGQKGPMGLLGGRSARLIVTMGMPAAVYRLIFGAFGSRAIARGILMIAGVRPARTLLLGGVETAKLSMREAWLKQVRRLGEQGR